MIDMKEWMHDVLHNPKRLVIPIMTNPGIELCNEKVINAVTNGEIHFEAIKKLNDTYPADACTVIMDLTVEAEAFGAKIVFPEDEVPSVIDRLVKDYSSVKALEVPTLNKGRVQEYLKANRLAAENITDKPIFGGCIGPYSLAGRLYDMTEMMMAIYTEPETITLLLEKCAQFIGDYCQAIKETGVNGIIIAEPAAGLISNDDCSLYSSKYVKQIVDKVQDDSFMVILHNCGNTGHCTEAMLEVGAMGYHFGNKANMTEILQQCSADVLVMGNIDPVGVLKMLPAEEVKTITNSLLEATKGYNNYVLSTGCDVPPHIPAENIEAFYNVVKEYNKQHRS